MEGGHDIAIWGGDDEVEDAYQVNQLKQEAFITTLEKQEALIKQSAPSQKAQLPTNTNFILTPVEEEKYKPKPTYLAAFRKKISPADDEKYAELLPNQGVCLPFLEAITKIPTYATHLKKLLLGKKKEEVTPTTTLGEEC